MSFFHYRRRQTLGKIERPYRWIQDILVRTCSIESISYINQAQLILNNLIKKYNYQQVHLTTREIPLVKCFRANKISNAYRKVSINKLKLKVKNVVSMK
ncbi:hypothetical protein KJ599_05710 [bacterium]|nr:hypothetical protein [bacterium]